MINDLLNFLNYENIYLIANWGVIPFWLMLLIMPNNFFTNFFIQSIIAPLILASAYVFVAINIFNNGNILDSFELYSGLEGLYSMFSDEGFSFNFLVTFFSYKPFCGRMDCQGLAKIHGAKIFCNNFSYIDIL